MPSGFPFSVGFRVVLERGAFEHGLVIEAGEFKATFVRYRRKALRSRFLSQTGIRTGKSSDFSPIASWAKPTPLCSSTNAHARLSRCRSLPSNRCASIAESIRDLSAETQAIQVNEGRRGCHRGPDFPRRRDLGQLACPRGFGDALSRRVAGLRPLPTQTLKPDIRSRVTSVATKPSPSRSRTVEHFAVVWQTRNGAESSNPVRSTIQSLGFQTLGESREIRACTAIRDHAWTRRTPSAARIRTIQQNLSGRDLARSMDHRPKSACRSNPADRSDQGRLIVRLRVALAGRKHRRREAPHSTSAICLSSSISRRCRSISLCCSLSSASICF
jgi:hypothetical protein